ncbi:MAG: nucleotide exchange factor GrpE [Candidatus Acidiferrales bacterium]
MAAHRVQREEEQAKPGIAPADPPGSDSDLSAAAAAEVALAEQVQQLVAEKQDLTSTLVRLQADFDNYRKRIEKERGQERHRGVELFVENLLPVLDGFDRALAAHDDPAYADYRKGFELIRRQLWDVLAKQGVQRIESVGKEFDPNVHHAIEQVVTTEYPDGAVIEELQPGYTFHNRVLRPAMVRVASGRKN